jgi:glycosyltransferase involved in cell wall biosynthesis
LRVAFIGIRGVPAAYSGFETCVEQVGMRMADRGHEVTVFNRAMHYPGRPAAHAGITIRHLPALRGKHTETLSHTVLAAAAARHHDAVVVMGVGNAPVVRAMEMSGRRAVFNVDGADWARRKWGGFASRYLRACEVLAAHGRSIVVADARAVQDHYLARHGRATEFVAYGADPPADTGTATLERFGLRPGRYLLFVGRLEPENGAADFLAAAARAGLGWPAVVVGGTTYPDAYLERLRRDAPTGTVFTGFQFGAAYQQLTAHAGIFVLAAEVGGTHPVLLEQMAAGNAILARDTPANREVLGEGGVTWRDADGLARELAALHSEPARRRALGVAAAARQRRLYDWEAVTDRYLELAEQARLNLPPAPPID